MRSAILCFLLILSASTSAFSEVDIFPLQTGNAWYFFRTYDERSTWPQHIGNTVVINDTTYYEFSYSQSIEYYVRKDDAGNVYFRREDSIEQPYYRVDAEVGDSWIYDTDYFDKLITLESTTDTVVTVAGTFTGCYRYSFASLPVQVEGGTQIIMDVDYFEWFAPGIGKVKSGSYGGDSPAFIKAKINGIVIPEDPPGLSIVNTLPANGSIDVTTDSDYLKIFLSFYIDPDTITGDALQVMSSTRGQLPGTVTNTFNNSIMTLIYNLESPLDYDETITITVSQELADFTGATLDEPYVCSFTTESASTIPPLFQEVSDAVSTPLHQADFDWGDWDHDGDLDLLIGGSERDFGVTDFHEVVELHVNENRIFERTILNVPAMRFTALQWLDMDNDLLLDFVVSGGEEYAGNKTLFFQSTGNSFTQSDMLEFACYSISRVEVNGDMRDDLVVSRANNLYRIGFIQSDDYVFQSIEPHWSMVEASVHCMDYNNDNNIDLLLTEQERAIILKNTDGLYAYVFSHTYSPGQYTFIDSADIDNDGYNEILMWPYVFNYKDGGFDVEPFAYTGDYYTAIKGCFNDFDHDGDPDLFMAGSRKDHFDRYHAYIIIYENNEGIFSPYQTLDLQRNLYFFDCQWIDVDGDQDLDCTGFTEEGFIIWYNLQDEIPIISGFNSPVPYSFLVSNYPNPFNPQTTITYTLPDAGEVTLSVYSVTGQQVAVLVDDFMKAGTHSVVFDGNGLASGVYFYRLQSTQTVKTGKMLLVK